MQEILDKVYSFLEEAAVIFAEHVPGYDANGPDSDKIMNLANEMADAWCRWHTNAIRLQAATKNMLENAASLRSGKGYAHLGQQPERDAAAHAMEYWAQRIQEELAEATKTN